MCCTKVRKKVYTFLIIFQTKLSLHCAVDAHRNRNHMSTNKNAQIRYQTLNRCFRNTGRMYFWEDLLKECNHALGELDPKTSGIQRRQLFDDICFMESPQGWSIPLDRIKFGKRTFYRYADPRFSINNNLLTETEINQLQAGLSVLARFKGIPQFQWIDEIITRLHTKFGLQENIDNIISFDINKYLTGIEFLSDLLNAILNKQVLLVRYKPFSSNYPDDLEIHPWHLKQYNNRWFLFGYHPGSEKLMTLALDRIKEVKWLKRLFIDNTVHDFNEYFEDIVGVSRPEDGVPVDITLLFTTSQAPYILTKPMHGSQRKIRYDDSGLEIMIHVIPNTELINLLLSFGENVIVKSPKSLLEIIKNHYSQAINNYP